MPLRPLKPVVREYDLGDLRLWQDDLAEVVRLMRQLPDIDIRLEADGNELDDVADLPELGPRVGYFTATASRQQVELMKLELSRSSCAITATEPDLETSGAIEAIRTFLSGRRRMPPGCTRSSTTPATFSPRVVALPPERQPPPSYRCSS